MQLYKSANKNTKNRLLVIELINFLDLHIIMPKTLPNKEEKIWKNNPRVHLTLQSLNFQYIKRFSNAEDKCASNIMDESNNLPFALFFTTIPFYVIGLIGNVLVIRIVHKTREMHTTTNYLLVNLAFSDIFTILMVPLFFFSYLNGFLSDGFGKFVCKFLPFGEISITVSSLTLTVLAVERYHALLKPFNTGLRLNEDNIKKAISLIWITSVLLCLPRFVFQEWSESHSTCVGTWSLHMNQETKVYVIINALFGAYMPLLAMLYCYGSLIKGLYFTNTICPESQGERTLAEKKKLVMTFVLATAGYFIGYGPFVVFHTIIASWSRQQISLKFYSDISSVFVFLFDCSLCLNPILYAFRSKNFQEGFKRIILCRTPLSQEEQIQLWGRSLGKRKKNILKFYF